MAIRRTRLDYEDQYTQIPNTWMRDRRISRRARGLLAEITTHRVGWRITIASLQEGGPEGRDAIRAGVQELIDAGYLIRTQIRSGNGRMQEVEYELCDPHSAAWKPDSGPDQDIPSGREPSTGRSTAAFEHSTAAWKTDVGSADVGSADVGSPTTKKEHLLEEQEQEHQGGAIAPTPTLTPTCPRHPKGTRRRCRDCGDARRLWDAARATPAPPPPPARRYDPDVYCPHLQLRTGWCDACAADARSALYAAGLAPAIAGSA